MKFENKLMVISALGTAGALAFYGGLLYVVYLVVDKLILSQ